MGRLCLEYFRFCFRFLFLIFSGRSSLSFVVLYLVIVSGFFFSFHGGLSLFRGALPCHIVSGFFLLSFQGGLYLFRGALPCHSFGGFLFCSGWFIVSAFFFDLFREVFLFFTVWYLVIVSGVFFSVQGGLSLFHGALRSQKQYGLLGTGQNLGW